MMLDILKLLKNIGECKMTQEHKKTNALLNIIADDPNLKTYRPELVKICGKITSTILLGQMLFWWKKQGSVEFYKFKEPCNHKLYKEGDSWCEELGFSRNEFDNAIKRIGFKLGKINKAKYKNKDQYEARKNKAFVIYYTTKGVTWYRLNTETLSKAINLLYLDNEETNFTKRKYESCFTITYTEITSQTTSQSLSKDKDDNSDELLKKGNVVLNNRVPVRIVKPIDKQKNTSDRKVNKSKKNPVAKYKHSTIDLRNYSEIINAGALKHGENQAKLNSLDKLHQLLSQKCKNLPYHFAVNISSDYVDFNWTVDDLLDAFKFQIEHTKIKPIKNIGDFIFTEGFNGSNPWSPLLKWHADMKKGITGKLNEQGKLLYKSLGQRKCIDIDKLTADEINKIAIRILPIENKYEFMNGKSTMNGYAYGIISVASEYIKEKQNNTVFRWYWITKPKFAEELLEHALKFNIMRKKTNGVNITLTKKVNV